MTMSLNVTTQATEPLIASNALDENAFPVSTRVLEGIARDVLRFARDAGASAAETEVSQAVGQSVTVRKGDVETIAYNRDKGISVTVYLGQQRGSASTAAPSCGQQPHAGVRSNGSRPWRHSLSARRPSTPASIGQRPPQAAIAAW